MKHCCPIILCVIINVVLAQAGGITGVVTNAQSGKKIVGATIIITGSGRIAQSDSTGGYAFDSVAPGSYNLQFAHPAFESLAVSDVYVSGDAVKRCDADLNPRKAAVDRMTVRATSFRRPPDMTSSTKIISGDELLRAPGVLMDVQRVVANLPSVSSGGDNTNEIVVRGGAPGENLFLLDNIEIPNPNHFAEQGTGGGVISLVNPLLVKGLTFNAGAPPAQYGGKASSVLDVKLRDGSTDMVLGGVDLGIAGAGVHLEGPLFSKQANFMFSATKSYLDFISHTSFNNQTAAVPEYWGLEARVADNTADHKIYANAIYGDNGITIDSASERYGTKGSTLVSGGYVYAGGVTWEQFVTSRLSTMVTVSGTGNTFDRLEYTASDTFFKNTSIELEQECKAQASLDFEGNNRLTVGAFVKRADFTVNMHDWPDTLRQYAGAADTFKPEPLAGPPVVWERYVDERDIGYKYGAFASGIWRPAPRLRVVPGLRFDAFTINKSYTVSPRLSASWAILPQLEATTAAGVQYQDPDYADLAACAFNKALKPKRAATGIGGLEYQFGASGVKCAAEGFYKRYDDMPVDSFLLSSTPPVPDKFNHSLARVSIGKGRSYGLELFAEKKLTKEFSWSAAYSLSKSEDLDPRPGHEGQWYRGDFDYINSLTLTGGWKKELLHYVWYKSLAGKLWFKILSPVMPVADRNEVSARWRYLGPRPHTSPEYDTVYHRWFINSAAALNSDVYGEYHKLDLRWERRFGFGFLQMIYYFDLQNVYDRKNIWTKLYTDGRSGPANVYQLSFFPAGGIIIGF